jgi:uncharacterized protein
MFPKVQFDQEAEGSKLGLVEVVKHIDDRILRLIFLPSEWCNFRCDYCYEEFDPKKTRMKPDVLLGVKRYLTKKLPGVQGVALNWFGGEPMVAYSDIVDIMTCVHRARESSKLSLDIVSSMTTNGSLLNGEKFRELVSLGVGRYLITLDGDTDYHDKHRVTIGGGATMARIWNNLVMAKNSNLSFEITLRVHVSAVNFESVQRLLQRIAKEFGSDKRFNVFIRPISRLGGKHDELIPVLGKGEDKPTIDELRHYAENLGLTLFEGWRVPVCYASAMNSIVIRNDGSVSKCTVALYDPLNSVGRITAEGEIVLDSAKFEWWTRGLVTRDAGTLLCPLKGGRPAWED